MFAKRAALAFLLTFTAGSATAQVGKETTYWSWTPRAKHHDSIVKIVSGQGHGTGVVVFADKKKKVKGNLREGYCLTAAHVVEEAAKRINAAEADGDAASNISTAVELPIKQVTAKTNPIITTATFSNGFISKCKIVEIDTEHDVAVMSVLVPDDIQPAPISKDPVGIGNRLEFSGLGGAVEMKDCMRHFSATASVSTTESQIFADVLLLPGDSGGPIFNEDREVVGVISGGWFWMDRGVVNRSGTPVTVTWPARGCNAPKLRGLLRRVARTRVANRFK